MGQLTAASVVILYFGSSALGGVCFEMVESYTMGREQYQDFIIFLINILLSRKGFGLPGYKAEVLFLFSNSLDANFRGPGGSSDARKHQLAIDLFSTKAFWEERCPEFLEPAWDGDPLALSQKLSLETPLSLSLEIDVNEDFPGTSQTSEASL